MFMQRIRETSRGLQITQGTEVLTFSRNRDETAISAELKASALDLEHKDTRFFVVDGRDTIRDLGEWFAKLKASGSDEGSFNSYTVSSHEAVGAISIARAKTPNLTELDDLGREIHELSVLTAALHGILQGRADNDAPAPLEVDVEAFAYPLGIPTGLTPVMLARQTADKLTLQFDQVHLYESVPMDAAQQFGEWVLSSLGTIQNRSIWG